MLNGPPVAKWQCVANYNSIQSIWYHYYQHTIWNTITEPGEFIHVATSTDVFGMK